MSPSRVISRSPEFASRLRALRAVLRTGGIDGMLVTRAANVRYLCGFTGSNGWLLVRPRSAVFVTDGRYAEQAATEIMEAGVLIADQERLSDALLRTSAMNGLARLGFEADTISFSLHKLLARQFRGHKLVPLAEAIEPLRQIKSAPELAAMRKAIAITEMVLGDVLGELRPGVTEREIAADITWKHRRAGADGDAFHPIVLFGKRTSLIHGQPGDTRLRADQLVLIDMGCQVRGYRSDVTRTVSFGRIPRRFRRMYESVREAQHAGCNAIREGVEARAVDALVRTMLDADGLGEYFGHALGHGLGIEVHEIPLLSRKNPDRLLSGQVVTIAPGVYIPGQGGIRIEDDVLVLQDGSETLTRFTRDLVEL